jgi:polar amino acid transport system substrate-binding protein
MLYAPAIRQGDPDWLHFGNTTWDMAMFGHQNAIFDQAVKDFLGWSRRRGRRGLPRF